jgi:magnesium transporter
MLTILVERRGIVEVASQVDPAWLLPDATETVWVDIEQPQDDDRRLLGEVFHFHELAVEDALSALHHPKIESYDGFLYLILHGIWSGPHDNNFETQDVDFFIGRNYLVTVHQGPSRSIEQERNVCRRHAELFLDGPVGLCHRIVHRLVDHYGPEVDALEEQLEQLEQAVFDDPSQNPIRQLLELKRDVATLRRVALPERDAVGRLARREFPQISEKMVYRFRDVYDQLVRLTDEAIFLQDRVTGLIEAHLSNQSNRLNQVMKVLTVIATIFMPLTVLTSMWGMNVTLPHLPGGDHAQFWWVGAVMVMLSGAMLWGFRWMRWL